jgi:hypothetical protein
VRAKFLSVVAAVSLGFAVTTAVGTTGAHADDPPALEARPVWAGGTFHFVADRLLANTSYTFSATSGNLQTVQSNASGTAVADLAIAGNVTATSTTVTVTAVGQSVAAITQAFVVKAPVMLPEPTSPWSADAQLAWFADGEIVDLTYGAGSSGPASATVPANASQNDPAGTGFPIAAIQFALSGAPSSVTVTAVGRTYHRSSTFTFPVTGTTLTSGQSRDAPGAIASSQFGYYFSIDNGPAVFRMAAPATAPAAVWRGTPLQPASTFIASTLGVTSAGDLVLTGTETAQGAANVVLWRADTQGTGTNNHATMQDDGNLVVYNASGQPVWSSMYGFAGPPNITAPTTLSAFTSLASPNGRYRSTVQSDGNFVTYDSVGTPVWHSQTFQYPGASVSLQSDGDLVARSGQTVVWHTDTAGSGAGGHLELQNDGSLVLFNAGNRPLWSSAYGIANPPTLTAPAAIPGGYSVVSPTGRFRATLQTDGNLVVYSSAGTPVWHARTFQYPGSTLCLQSDGNLVIYSAANAAIWDTHTSQPGATNHLTIQDDGNLVLYTSTGKPVWNSLGFPV